jgi:hypothetical protein
MEQGRDWGVRATAVKVQGGAEFAHCRRPKVCISYHAIALLIHMPYREQVSQLKSEQSVHFKGLDLTTRKIIDAIIQQQDVFEAAHDTQIALMDTIHQDTVSMIQSEHEISRRKIIGETVASIRDEHEITRRDIIRELRVRHLPDPFITLLNCF